MTYTLSMCEILKRLFSQPKQEVLKQDDLGRIKEHNVQDMDGAQTRVTLFPYGGTLVEGTNPDGTPLTPLQGHRGVGWGDNT